MMAFRKGFVLVVAVIALALQTSNAVQAPGDNWSDLKDACIKRNNIKENQIASSIEACRELCITELGSLCGSVDFNPTKNKCNLQMLRSDSSAYTEPCYARGGWLYSEREVVVDAKWSDLKDACIKENNFRGGRDNVPTLDACRELCIAELGSLCASVDFNPAKNKCNLQMLRSDSSAYTEPCYASGGWLYSEREVVDNAEWTEFKDACIIQENIKQVLDVPTIDACRELCITELGSDCASIDYNTNSSKCNLQDLRSDSEAYAEPCGEWLYWVYSERVIGDEPHCEYPNGQIYWPHPTECNKFIQCTAYGPEEMTCAPGTGWSQALHTCDSHTVCGKPTPPPAPVCPEPFKMRGDECFYVTEGEIEPLNWDDSRQKCLGMGADLAMPHDMVDFVNYIKESYPESKSTIWLGATDREVEQEWKWLSGEPVPAEMWNGWPGKQPSGDGNCMEIHYWPRTDFYMNDWHCNKQGHYACEFDMSGR